MSQGRVRQGRPDSYVNPTGMAQVRDGAATAAGLSATSAGEAPSTATAEQDAKRVEKIRSHASSHHTACTVTLDT